MQNRQNNFPGISLNAKYAENEWTNRKVTLNKYKCFAE